MKVLAQSNKFPQYPPKMETTLFVPSKLMVHRKFMMFEFPSMNTLDWVRYLKGDPKSPLPFLQEDVQSNRQTNKGKNED